MTTAIATVQSALRAAFARPAPMLVSAWAEKYRQVIPKGSSQPGPWRNHRTPYLRGVMDAVNDPGVSRITLMKGEQLGGTEAILNILEYIVDRAPGPVLYIYPTDKVAETVNVERVLPTLKACQQLAPYRHRSPRAEQTREFRFQHMTIRFAGSNAMAGLESFAYKYVIIDELDRCMPSVASVVAGRGVTYPGFKLIEISTPEDEFSGDESDGTVGIDRAFKVGDQRVLHVPCPHCRHYHRRMFSGIKWIGGLEANADDVLKQAWYQCPHPGCGREIYAHENQKQLSLSVWVPKGWMIEGDADDGHLVRVDHLGEKAEDAGMQCGGSAPTPPEGIKTEGVDGSMSSASGVAGAKPMRLRTNRIKLDKIQGGHYLATGSSHASFHLQGIYSPFPANVYGNLAREFVDLKGQMTRHFVTKRLGDPWRKSGERMDRNELRVLCTPVGGGGGGHADLEPGYSMGTVPKGVLGLTAFCDVQQDCLYVTVVGWTAGGRKRYLIDARRLHRKLDDGLEALLGREEDRGTVLEVDYDKPLRGSDVLPMALWTYPVVDLRTGEACAWTGGDREPLGRSVMPISFLFVDSGKWTSEVYDAVRPRQRGKWRGAKVRGMPGKTDGGGGEPATIGIGPGVIATKGAAPGGATGFAVKPFEWSAVDYTVGADGRRVETPGGLRLLLMNVSFFKRSLRDELKVNMEAAKIAHRKALAAADIAAGRPMSEGLTSAMAHATVPGRTLHLPADCPREYLEQVTSEEEKTVMRAGVRATAWQLKPGVSQNHYLDCEVGNAAGAEAMGVKSLNG